jgi:hypothetical protein
MGKLSFGLGVAAGYVLGAQAGRSRYEQIKQAASGLMGRPEVRQALDKARTAAPEPLRPGIEKLTQAASGGQAGGAGTGGTGTPPAAADEGGGAPGYDGPLPDPLVPPARSADGESPGS